MSMFAMVLSLLAPQSFPVPEFSEEAQSSTAAQSDPFDSGYAECQLTAPPELQTSGDQYRRCGEAWRKRAAAMMRQELASTLSTLTSRRAKEALTGEQHAFEAAMTARCAEYTTEDYGQMGLDLDWFACEARLMSARIIYLRAFARGRGAETPYN